MNNEVSLPEGKKLIDLAISEVDFQDMVVDAFQKSGWLVHAERPARSNKGWRTPIQGDPGFLDLVLARGEPDPRIIFAEVKSEEGRETKEQKAWGIVLASCTRAAIGIDTFLWRPSNWQEILAILGG